MTGEEPGGKYRNTLKICCMATHLLLCCASLLHAALCIQNQDESEGSLRRCAKLGSLADFELRRATIVSLSEKNEMSETLQAHPP